MLPGTSAARCVGSHIRRFSHSGQWPRVMVARTCPQISCSVPKKMFDIRQDASFRMASVNIRGFATTVQSLQANRTANNNACYSANTMSIATYEEVLDLPNHPEKLLIDVRNPDELADTGKIPTSINIPLDKVKQAFGPETSDEAFAQQYGVPKPGLDHYLILSCRTGRRSQMALEAIAELGYRNARNYKGSWTEWAEKQGK
uniref:rhodanese domain-containing protein CG4456 isoform X1 n=1 Tax=Anopheles coluzzii TaxID=1518534 RepID=UPI0020FFBBC2|nr:rhodanese domain-containing protein CG4456 isoform X1 [Anopheles coluzzii]XP_049462528.1 rhodanese domain-containing protein CG4456 isoform X2 [Anopheles coluzzii]